MTHCDMTKGTPWKSIFTFALPIMAANLLQQLYNTADTLIVGRFESELALSAVGSCSSLTLLFTGIALGLSVGVGVLIAQYYGAEKIDALCTYASTAMQLLLAIGVLSSLIGIVLSPWLLQNIMHTPVEMLPYSVLYFRIYAVGLVFQFGYNVISAILRAVGDSRATLLFLLISSSVNIVLDLLFVATWKQGVAGAAIATVIAQGISCVVAFSYMYQRHEMFRICVRLPRFSAASAKDILRVGAPMAIQQTVVSCGFVSLQRLVNFYGDSMIASYTVASRIESILQIPLIGIQNTMATYAGQNMGAGRVERVSQGLKHGVFLSFALTSVLTLCLSLLMEPIIGSFGITAEATRFCVQHLRCLCFSILLFAIYFPANGMFQGVGKGSFSMLCAIFSLGMRVVFAYSLHTTSIFAYTAIWWSHPLSCVLVLALCYGNFFRGAWKNSSLVK